MINNSSIKSVAKALCIIKILCNEDSALSLKEISSKLDIPQSTVSGILSTLTQFNFVEKLDNYRYEPSIYLFELGNTARNKWNVHTIASFYMEKMAKEIKETINLVVLDKGKVLYIDKKKAPYKFQIGTQVGTRLHAHCTAVGKVLLAFLPKAKVREIIKKEGIPKYTENTITSVSKLESELEKIKIQGYAVDKEEFIKNLTCIAAPISNHKGEKIAALSISGLSSRLKGESLKKAIKLLKNNTLSISKKMGYNEMIHN